MCPASSKQYCSGICAVASLVPDNTSSPANNSRTATDLAQRRKPYGSRSISGRAGSHGDKPSDDLPPKRPAGLTSSGGSSTRAPTCVCVCVCVSWQSSSRSVGLAWCHPHRDFPVQPPMGVLWLWKKGLSTRHPSRQLGSGLWAKPGETECQAGSRGGRVVGAVPGPTGLPRLERGCEGAPYLVRLRRPALQQGPAGSGVGQQSRWRSLVTSSGSRR
jgi:hypothetical protein